MKRLTIGIVILLVILVSGSSLSAGEDLLNKGNGAFIISASSEYGENWAAGLLLDGTTTSGWCSAASSPFPHTIVIGLSRAAKISQFVVDTTNTQEDGYPGISARDFKLYASSDSESSGFELVMNGEAAKGGRRVFSLDYPVKARWLKLVVVSNWGNEEYTEIMELEAYGEQSSGGPHGRNLLNGASVSSVSSEYSDGWKAQLLTDGTTNAGWCSEAGASFPHTIVMELQRTSRISKFVVDNTNTQEGGYPGISARRFTLYVSTLSPDSMYTEVLRGEAAQGTRRAFSLDAPVEARWIKLVVNSNYGHADYTEIMEIEAYGD